MSNSIELKLIKTNSNIKFNPIVFDILKMGFSVDKSRVYTGNLLPSKLFPNSIDYSEMDITLIRFDSHKGPIYVPLNVLTTIQERKKYFYMPECVVDNSLLAYNYWYYKSDDNKKNVHKDRMIDSKSLKEYFWDEDGHVLIRDLIKKRTRVH